MKKGNMNKWMKRATAGLLSAALVMAGTLVLPETAEAADGAAVKYVKMAMSEVPAEEGYLFGGWYKDAEGTEPVEAAEKESYDGDTYAKLVPAYVLSVKAQVDDGATSANDGVKANMRILTSLDSTDYQYVGVQVGLNNADIQEYDSTKVYKNLVIGSGDTANKMAAADVFGAASQYMGAWKIANISDTNDSKIIYVRPFWVTMDGTKVYGLAKYVHVEDSYNKYVSIPVNLMTGADTTAAGIVEMTYDSTNLEFVGVENGRVSNDEMEEDHSSTGNVKIVGNEKTVNEYAEAGESLFANVRFKWTGGDMYTTDANNIMTRSSMLTFSITGTDFSNWEEETVVPGAWDIQY